MEWRGAVTNPPPAGAHELQGLDAEKVTEVGEVIAKTKPGRRSADGGAGYGACGQNCTGRNEVGLV